MSKFFLFFSILVFSSVPFLSSAQVVSDDAVSDPEPVVIVAPPSVQQSILSSFSDEPVFFDESFDTSFFVDDLLIGNDSVEVILRAFDLSSGDPIGFGLDHSLESERIRIHGYPTMVPDGTFTQECDDLGNCYQVSGYRYDPAMALKIVLDRFVSENGLIGAEVVPGSVGHTVEIIFPSADGDVSRVNANCVPPETYSQLRSGAGTTTNQTNTTTRVLTATTPIACISPNFSQNTFSQYFFNTSPVQIANDEVTSAYLSVNPSLIISNLTGASSSIYLASNPNVSFGNANYAAAISTEVALSVEVPVSTLSVNTFKQFDLLSSQYYRIKGASSTLSLVTANQMNNVTPTWVSNVVDQVSFKSMENASSTDRPYLTVVHSLPSGGDPFPYLVIHSLKNSSYLVYVIVTLVAVFFIWIFQKKIS